MAPNEDQSNRMSETGAPAERPGRLTRLWRYLRHPGSSAAFASLVAICFAAGIFFWGSFNWTMELTNTETFCIVCHEMERNVYNEFRTRNHYANRTGVRATCPDCHVPKEWVHKIARKIQASNELYHHFLGSINTREKFEAKRLQLAQNVWNVMKSTDSRECRNCHNFNYMELNRQEPRAARRHQEAVNAGMTCIDCHKGIAHQLPAGAFDQPRQTSQGTN